MLVLSNNKLKVYIARPGIDYIGSRFDWHGLISQIEFDGKFTICTKCKIHDNKGEYGEGFCNEFGLKSPLGYNETKVGSRFTKIGVGALKKYDDTPYYFDGPFDFLPVDIHINEGENKISFASSYELGHYAFDYTKTIQIDGNKVIVQYTLKNKGNKIIINDEYAHNFISINRTPINGRYKLNLPVNILEYPYEEHIDPTKILNIKPSGISLNQKLKSIVFYSVPFKQERNIKWELMYNKEIKISETTDFLSPKFVFWAAPHAISPEIYKMVRAKPGEAEEWTRTYEFERI